MENTTTIDQIFQNIDERGILKTSLNALDNLNFFAKNIIERALKQEYESIHIFGKSHPLIVTPNELSIMASEINDTSIESIAKLAHVPKIIPPSVEFYDYHNLLTKLNDAVFIGLIDRGNVYSRFLHDYSKTCDPNPIFGSFASFLHSNKLFNLLTISQLFHYKEFDEIRKRIDDYVSNFNSSDKKEINEYDLSLEDIIFSIGKSNKKEAILLFNSISEKALITTTISSYDDGHTHNVYTIMILSTRFRRELYD